MSGVVVCGEIESSCVCVDEPDHRFSTDPVIAAHHCDCGGSWTYDELGFKALTLPQGFLAQVGPIGLMDETLTRLMGFGDE